MNITERHEYFMGCALALAKKAWGATHPNPMVGAVIVEDDLIVAEGFHAKDGGFHAERIALAALGRPPRAGATLYVTLEPCSTPGRTGACCDLIRATSIKRVVVGATDPNPLHAGRGFEVLKSSGVEVISGVLERECEDLNLIYNHWIKTGSALLAAKAAVTLDGKIATRTGESKWITGEVARADVMSWRRLFPAIAVGAGTVAKDNPRLTSRMTGDEWCPWRFLFDGRLRLVADNNLPNLFTDEYREKTIVVTTQHGGLGYVRKLQNLGVKIWVIESATARIGMSDFRKRCTEEKITGVLFEGGAHLGSELLHTRDLDYLFVYRAPLVMADEKAKSPWKGIRTEKLAQAIRLSNVQHASFGDDQLIRGHVVYPEKLSVDETLFGVG